MGIIQFSKTNFLSFRFVSEVWTWSYPRVYISNLSRVQLKAKTGLPPSEYCNLMASQEFLQDITALPRLLLNFAEQYWIYWFGTYIIINQIQKHNWLYVQSPIPFLWSLSAGPGNWLVISFQFWYLLFQKYIFQIKALDTV